MTLFDAQSCGKAVTVHWLLRRFVEDLEDSVGAGERVLELVVAFEDHLERFEEALEQNDKCAQLTNAQAESVCEVGAEQKRTTKCKKIERLDRSCHIICKTTKFTVRSWSAR